MKICKGCNEKKKNSEFNKCRYGELSDICKDCEEERKMDEEEREGWDDIADYYN